MFTFEQVSSYLDKTGLSQHYDAIDVWQHMDSWRRLGPNQMGKPCGRGWVGLRGACQRAKHHGGDKAATLKASKLALADKIRGKRGLKSRESVNEARKSVVKYRPNVELIRSEGVRLIAGSIPRDIRKQLNDGVKLGHLGHLKKNGLEPEAYFHPDQKQQAIESRNSKALSAIKAIATVSGSRTIELTPIPDKVEPTIEPEKSPGLTSKRLEVLKNSLEKKHASFESKFTSHASDVRSANGQPLNDKRNGASTMSRWEDQSRSLRNTQMEIAKTEKAIVRESEKLWDIEHTQRKVPKTVLKMVESGDLAQWGKHPHIFFVKGVDKARIAWSDKKKQFTHSYTDEITDKDQWKKFANTYNSLKNGNHDYAQFEDDQKPYEAPIDENSDGKFRAPKRIKF